MRYVSVTYQYSPGFTTPESWFKLTAMYGGIFVHLANNNRVISVNQIDYVGDAVTNGVEYKFVNLNREKTHLPFKLNRFVKQLNPDVVIVQGLHNPIQVILLHAILPKRVKIIAHHHAEKPMPGIKKYAQKLADRFVDAYLFASLELGLGWVQKGVISKYRKIYEVMEVSSNFYPIDKKLARQKTGATGAPVFLWVGRLNDNKDPLNTVRAFLKYLQGNQAAHLYMIYHTNELLAEIKDLINKGSATNNVSLVGQTPHDDLQYWFNSADFILSGSHYEGSGTAVCEAMSCGCVPVVTDIPSFRMITDNGKCGLLYEPGNETELLNALNSLDKLDIKEKKDRCLSHFKEKLSFSAIAQGIEKVVAGLQTN